MEARIAIIAAKFNRSIVDGLVTSSRETLLTHNFAADSIKVFWVPGAYELPFFAKQIILSNKFQAAIALGSVIRGETPHFDYVSHCCLEGLNRLAIEFNFPITCGVLTTENKEQAVARSQGDKKNRGKEAALAMIDLLQALSQVK